MSSSSKIVISSSSKYNEASLKFRDAWGQYQQKEELVKHQVVNMVTILEKDGFTRTNAIQKIIDDHSDLKGFSRKTIYRELPEDMKQSDSRRDLRKLRENDQDVTNKRLDVSNDTYEDINRTTSRKPSAKHDEIIEEEEPPIIYDPKFVDNLIKTNAKYEELIRPFECKVIATIKNEDIPFIVRVDPSRQSVTSLEVDQKELKKIIGKQK